MSSLLQRASDAIAEHSELVILGFAVTVLFLVIALFLWSRRAALLEGAVEELLASREALSTQLQRPAVAGNQRAAASYAAPSVREVYSVTTRKPGVAILPTASSEAASASQAAPAPIEGPAEVPADARSESAPEVPAASAEVPVLLWDGTSEEATPLAASWAVTAPAEPVVAPGSLFRTMSFVPQSEGPKAPTFAFSRAGETEPEREPERPALIEPEPATSAEIEPDPAYDDWESLRRAAGAASPLPPARVTAEPSYAAWSEVTAAAPVPSPAKLDGLDVVTVPTGVNGNGHAHDAPNGHENGSHAEDPSEPAELGALAEPAGVTDGHRGPGGILLVEDDANVAKIYRLVLESKGHTVRHAGDGVAALDEVRKGRPDLVLLDVMMPRMNGILFLQSLRAQPDLRDVPVVILSNFREPRLVERAMALGALEYVVKAQTRPEVLVNAIPRWIAGERAFTA
jgi:CheY-like chemotaxis protein